MSQSRINLRICGNGVSSITAFPLESGYPQGESNFLARVLAECCARELYVNVP